MRCHEGAECNYDVKLTDAQRAACRSLQEVLDSPFGCISPSTDSEVAQRRQSGESWYDEASSDHSAEDSDEEMYDDTEERPSDVAQDVERDAVAENPLQSCILELLISLYTHLPSGNDDKFYSPILRFTVLFSLKRSGQWLPPRQITRLLAVLLFCGREVIMSLMHRHILAEPTLRYSEYVFINGDDTTDANRLTAVRMAGSPHSWTTTAKDPFRPCIFSCAR